MEIIEMPLGDLKMYENNPRKNSEAVQYVMNSIREFGFKNPIIIDRDNVIVCGHTRFKAASRLRMQTVPCIRADDLTEDQIRAFRLADNKTRELAGWDYDKLEAELNSLDPAAFDLADFGFFRAYEAADNDDGYVIDSQGYVHEYDEGSAGAVAISNPRGGRIIHNHPSNGEPAFSFEDLDNFASQKAQSVTASSRGYDYTIERGTHFREKEFREALSKAKIRGYDYSDGVHNWLRDNAGRYGYKYTRNTYDRNGNLVRTYRSSTKPRGKRGR